MRGILLATFLLLSSLGRAFAAMPVVEVHLEPARVFLGAPARLLVELRASADTKIDLSALAEAASTLEGVRPSPVERSQTGDEVRYRFQADLVRFELGASEGARASVPWSQGEQSGKLELWLPAPEVLDVPARAGDQEGRLRSAKGVVALPPLVRWWIPVTLLVGILMMAGGWWLGRRGTEESLSLEPPEPPFEKAMRLLRAVEQKGDAGDPRSFHYRLSEILREYLSGRFGLAGLSETSYELMVECRAAKLDPLFLNDLEPLLDSMDVIKFGPEDADSESSVRHLASCFDLVRSTEPVASTATKEQKTEGDT